MNTRSGSSVTNKKVSYLCIVNQMQKSMNIENPFIFGRAAEGTYFTDREEDAKRLTANLTHSIHTILISPRRCRR
jgi:hypothetical protein